ncbi:MAG: ABC transporter ATP-binding protein [Candidatus Peregrinibacteria bacterium]
MRQKTFSTIGKIFSILRGINIHPWYLIIPVVFSVSSAIIEGISVGLLIPMLNGLMTKNFSFLKTTKGLSTLLELLPTSITSSNRSLLILLLCIFVSSVILKNIFRYLSVLGMSYIATRSHHHLRKVMFGRFLTFGKLFFDRTSTGHHTTIFSEFSYDALRPIFQINKYINALFSLLVYLLVMWTISWKITFFALPLFFILNLVVKRIIRNIKGYSVSLAQSGSDLGKKTVEILSTLLLVKSYCTEDAEKKHYAEISDRKARLDYRIAATQELIFPLQEIITLLAALLLFAGMLYLMSHEQTSSSSSFIVYFYLVINSANKFGTLSNIQSVIASAEGALNEVMGVFDDTGKEHVEGGGEEFTSLSREIAFRNLSFIFPGGRKVLDDVSFTINKGEMVAIVGPTGGGKTTIINLLMRFYDCPPNSLFIDGKDIRSFTIPSLRKHVALVSQETQLFHSSLFQNVSYGLPHVTVTQVEKAVAQARLTEYIRTLPLGLQTLVGDRGVKLSGGEKQRVSIARALLKGSEILILDEATSSLDSGTEHLIQEAINEAIKDKTAIVIAHRLSTIQHADRIVVIDHGHVAEQGTREELLAKHGIFYDLWEQQKFV